MQSVHPLIYSEKKMRLGLKMLPKPKLCMYADGLAVAAKGKGVVDAYLFSCGSYLD